jgi:hypothetical protein
LDVFWSSHDPTARPWSTQYASIIFYHSDEQERLAVEARDREATERGHHVFTEVAAFSGFYLAEDYHQKYQLRREPELVAEYTAMYPNGNGFVDSASAARVNGYLGGHGTLAGLQEEIDSLGLSPEGNKRLTDIVSRSGR